MDFYLIFWLSIENNFQRPMFSTANTSNLQVLWNLLNVSLDDRNVTVIVNGEFDAFGEWLVEPEVEALDVNLRVVTKYGFGSL